MREDVAAIMKRLPVIVDDRDREMTEATAQGLLDEGWTPNDVIRYLLCTEEVSPDLDEATALERMAAIRAHYEREP
jgi:hypothetical protein